MIVIPPFGFWIAVSCALRILGEERIVFYQAAGSAWAAAVGVAAIAGLDAWRVSDLVIVSTAIFLAFGRVGCFHVACCHGRPSRFGVQSTHVHAALAFPTAGSDARSFRSSLSRLRRVVRSRLFAATA